MDERHYDQWLILSALHGLVHPDTVLRPCELSSRQLTAGERELWANHIAVELTDRFPAGTVLWFHAGVLYRQAIAPVVPHQVRCPLAGLGSGRQVAWYRRHAYAYFLRVQHAFDAKAATGPRV